MCVLVASEKVISTPDMLRARVFPDNAGTWHRECRVNVNLAKKHSGSEDDDDWWATRTSQYLLVELRAELINCMEAYAKATGFRAPGSQLRKKRRTEDRTRDDPANLSSGDEGNEEEGKQPGPSGEMEVDEFGEAVLDGGCGVHITRTKCECCSSYCTGGTYIV